MDVAKLEKALEPLFRFVCEHTERIANALKRQAEAQELLALAISEANVVEGFHPESAAGVLYDRIRARHEKGGM